MDRPLPIGDFSRATHLSIKTLRHYHRIGLLEPGDIDPGTGHRCDTSDQITTAQFIRRYRSLGMPLEEIYAVISAPDRGTRNHLISSHLSRLESTLKRAQQAAASLRDLLHPPAALAPAEIECRRVAAIPAVAVRDTLDLEDTASWFRGALSELYATIAAQELAPAGQGQPRPAARVLRRRSPRHRRRNAVANRDRLADLPHGTRYLNELRRRLITRRPITGCSGWDRSLSVCGRHGATPGGGGPGTRLARV